MSTKKKTEQKEQTKRCDEYIKHWEAYSYMVIDPVQQKICLAMALLNEEAPHRYNALSPFAIHQMIVGFDLAGTYESLLEKTEEEVMMMIEACKL